MPLLNTPITPRENFLMFLQGEEPLWMPFYCDMLSFTPAVVPDNVSRGFVFDDSGFDADKDAGGPDMFSVEWEWVPTVGGSMVRPGAPKVPDITEWEKYISFPDVDSWDWAASAETNKRLIAQKDLLPNATIMNGLFKRLISFCDMDEALVSMVDEDAQEGVHRLFDQLADFYPKLIRKYKEYYHVEMITFHDDWGSQRAPFFSLDTVEEMLVYIIGCLVAGGVAALRYAKKRYSLIDRFISLTATSTPEDAVRSIEQSLRQAADQRRELEYQEHDNAREKLLDELLIDTGTEVPFERLQLYDIVLDRSRFAAAVFLTDSYEELFFGEEQELDEFELADMAYTIVRSVTEELCGALARCYVTRVRGTFTALLSFNCQETELDHVLEECVEFIASNFGLRFRVVRGMAVQEPRKLPLSLKDAMTTRDNSSTESELATPEKIVAETVRSYIDAHYFDSQLTIPAIAEVTGFSTSHISHTFKQNTGITVLEYINGVRISEAKKLLRSTNYSAAVIADRVGYTNFQAFTARCGAWKE